ncbi:MAG TPA: SusC/RagA family TonB-linked outer membrane protein [Porphyromonadaceae bacterium]|jgi:TonB-linked SusC/RagA family outer membrane protein|nr:SusC/RagA family TonB-linked outer membrane protein [Porphyromonadaceae bacterium]HBL33880.1 SusC/RagA family TonB-linked outer membrane protein [Porphyromonadaceae bacterium]HCM20572.1 SusC/RagA family TonB-linked outer membrane protein [Porphyromonadaceae bacterium]
MNKYSIEGKNSVNNFKQVLKIMRITLFLLFFSILFSRAANSYSQETELTLHVKSASIKEICEQLEKKSDFRFIFAGNVKKTINKKVSLTANAQNIEKILDNILSNTELVYKIIDSQIVIYRDKTTIVPKKIEESISEQIIQQKKEINGKVFDKTGQPVIGANIIEVGTTSNGTVTDMDGNFSLSVETNAIIRVSYIGYISHDILTVGKTTFDIVLQEDTKSLEELVVVGYGTQKKINLTGSVSSVDMSKIAETRPITNISSGLAGLAPGLYVKSTSNDPGSNASLQIRGQGTLNNSAPLVIIDGVEGNIGYITPQDVASITVLKDAASSSIYGSRAANGVILITTKQAEEGKLQINYDGYVAFQSIGSSMPFVNNSVEYMELQNEAARNSKVKENFSKENIKLWRDNQGGDPLLWPNMDWMDATFRNTHTFNHNVSAQGGTDKIRNFMSFNYSNSPGIIENTGYEKYQLRLNSQLNLAKHLMVGANLTGSLSDKDRGSNSLSGMFSNAMAAVPTVVNKSPDGRYGGTNNLEDVQTVASPLWYMNQYKGDNTIRTFSSKFYANLNPIKGLNINGSYSYNYYDAKVTTQINQNDRWNFQTNTVLASGKTDLYITNTDARDVRNFMDADISYENRAFDDQFYFKAMAGASQEQYKYETFSATKYNLIDENLTQIGAATGEASASGSLSDWAMRSFFGRINLIWNDKYLVELNIRRDGSSRFVEDNRWGNFPSASAGWRISEESFMQPLKNSWLNNLKIRASYGSLGNNSVGNYESIPVLTTTQYPLNNLPIVGFYQSAIANANLTWESTYVTNLGFDFGLFSNRLTGTFDYYDKFTKNILISLPASLENGLVTFPKQNVAEVQNRGFEITLGWQDNIEEFNYFINGNLSYNKNEVIKFKGTEHALSGNLMTKEGLPINTQYLLVVDRIVQTQEDLNLIQKTIDNAPLDDKGNKLNPFPMGKPELGDFLYKDANNDGIINMDDRKTTGHGASPKFMYALSFGASYKGFDFSCQMDGVTDMQTYFQNDYYTPNLRHSNVINKDIAEGRWYEGRTSTATFPRFLLGNARNTTASDFWLQNSSYLKIRNIQLGYTLPKNLLSSLNVTRLRIYSGLENFFTFTDYSGLDPEVSGMGYPTMKQVVFGFNLSF